MLINRLTLASLVCGLLVCAPRVLATDFLAVFGTNGEYKIFNLGTLAQVSEGDFRSLGVYEVDRVIPINELGRILALSTRYPSEEGELGFRDAILPLDVTIDGKAKLARPLLSRAPRTRIQFVAVSGDQIIIWWDSENIKSFSIVNAKDLKENRYEKENLLSIPVCLLPGSSSIVSYSALKRRLTQLQKNKWESHPLDDYLLSGKDLSHELTDGCDAYFTAVTATLRGDDRLLSTELYKISLDRHTISRVADLKANIKLTLGNNKLVAQDYIYIPNILGDGSIVGLKRELSGRIRIIDKVTQSVIRDFSLKKKGKVIGLSGDDKYLIYLSDGAVLLVNTSNGEVEKNIELSSSFTMATISHVEPKSRRDKGRVKGK